MWINFRTDLQNKEVHEAASQNCEAASQNYDAASQNYKAASQKYEAALQICKVTLRAMRHSSLTKLWGSLPNI